MTGLRWRVLWPAVLVAVCLVALCVFTAVSLFHQQATVARVFRENVESRRAAVELEECLIDLIALQRDQDEHAVALYARVRTHLGDVQGVADEPTEQRLADQMSTVFDSYLKQWPKFPPRTDPTHKDAFREASRFLETKLLAPCTDFRLYNGVRLEEITEQHARVLNQLAWGMAGIAGLGVFAGIVFGFGVARALSRSIRRLQVQIRNAAGKLGPDLPEIIVHGEGEFDSLQSEIDRLTARIERVVQELHDREREVARAEQLAAVGQLAAGVGHEIRNPLTAIKMLVQAALEDRDHPGLSPEDLQVIESEIRRMERSLRTFLEFARPPRPERRKVDLAGVINTALALVRGRVDKQRVVTRVEMPPEGVTLTADAGQLQQVFVNLILNALDAMPTGGTLLIKVRPMASRTEIEVVDTGPGIPREIMPRLFQPFVSSKETGLGLGLVISQRIVEDHGGVIGAANSVSGGATFIVQLPND